MRKYVLYETVELKSRYPHWPNNKLKGIAMDEEVSKDLFAVTGHRAGVLMGAHQAIGLRLNLEKVSDSNQSVIDLAIPLEHAPALVASLQSAIDRAKKPN